MADEILKRDQNNIVVLAGVTNDASQEIRMLRVDPTTKRLLVSAVGGAGTGDVVGPATNTDSYIPQWDGADSKTLKNGLAVPAGGLAGLTALGDKAPLASPTFTGTVTLPKTIEIQDTSADHQYVLAVSELTADRTITLPLLTGTDTFVFQAHIQTLTNKRKQPRVYSTTSTATLTPEIDTYDVFHVTAQAEAITIANHSTSTPADGEVILIRFLDNGTARAISHGTNYVAKNGSALLTTTTLGKNSTELFEWNANLSKWNLLASATEA